MIGIRSALATIALAGAAQDAPVPTASPVPAASNATAAPAPPNLLFVTMDTTRADHLGCYGYPRPTTPQIDRFAAESIVFEDCQTALTHTTPSHASIFTGVYPLEHGVLACSFRATDNVQEALALTTTPQLRTIAEILKAQGWHTGGFVTAATTKKVTGLGAGFDAWGEPEQEVRPGAEALQEALAWLDQVPEPFFLWAHFFDAHAPPRAENRHHLEEFAPDAALREHIAKRRIGPPVAKGKQPTGKAALVETEITRYDAGIRLIDDHFAALRAKLEQRGAWGRTTVLIVGDHGEGLSQHNVKLHGPVWREGLHVPFLLRIPGRAAERVPMVVSTIDTMVTAIAATPGFPADDFVAQARGRNVLDPQFEERAVFSMSPPKNKPEFALTTDRWKWINRTNGKDVLFDLDSDPFELNDVRLQHPEIANGLDRQLIVLIAEQRQRNLDLYGGVRHGTPLSPEAEAQIKAQLKALGYVDDEPKDDSAPAVDPEHEVGEDSADDAADDAPEAATENATDACGG